MDAPYTRRRFLRTTGATAAIYGGIGQVRAAEKPGRLVFTYDDGPVEDYKQTFPVHQEEGVPACSAIIPGRLGEDGWLSVNQLREMQSAGWEVMSHTSQHRALARVPVTREVRTDDTRLYVRSAVHGRTPAPIRVWNGDQSVTADVTGSGEDETGPYLELAEPLGKSFPAEETFERFTDDVLTEALAGSKASLEDHGFRVTGLVVPFGRYSDHVRQLAGQHYQSVANATLGGLNREGYVQPLSLSRQYFNREEATEADIERFLDEVARGGVLGVLGGHSQYESLDPERVRRTIRMAKERDIEIQTLQGALSDLGHIETQTATATPSPPGSEGGDFLGPVDDFFADLLESLGI